METTAKIEDTVRNEDRMAGNGRNEGGTTGAVEEHPRSGLEGFL